MKHLITEQWRKEVEARFQRALSSAVKERNNSINLIAKLESSDYITHTSDATQNESGYGDLTKSVKNIICLVSGDFDRNDIIRALSYHSNTNSMDTCLHQLIKQGFIKVVNEGSGRRSAKYRKIKTEFKD